MQQTLFFIPYEIFGFPVFGFGILLILWLAGSLAGAVLYWKYAPEKSLSDFLINAALALFAGFVLCGVLPKVGRAAGIPIQAYGTMMLLGILTSAGLAIFRAKKFGFTADQIFGVSVCICVCGILGARAFFVIEYWSSFQAPTFGETLLRIINIPEGGLVVYGALIGGVIGSSVYLLAHHLSIPRMMDLLAPSMVLGLALGRIGCFLNGCCFGGVCDVDHQHWGVHFPAGSPPFTRQLEEGEISLDPDDYYYGMRLAGDRTRTAPAPTFIVEVKPGSLAEKQGLEPGDYILRINGLEAPERMQVIGTLIEDSRQDGKIEMELSRNEGAVTKSWVTTSAAGPVSHAVWPAQLFSSGNAFVLFVLLLLYSRFRRNPCGLGMRRDGEVFLLFLTLYPISRFILEMIRTDEAAAFGTQWSISQNVSVALILIAGALWVTLLTRRPKEEAALK